MKELNKNIGLPKDVMFILKAIQSKGYDALVVGGCVRDSLLGIKPNDYDIATNAPYDELKIIFKDCKPKEVGKAFGVLLININNIDYEIAKYRTDGAYSDNRRPDDVKFVDTFYEDASRRDFTVNAIGYDGHNFKNFDNALNDIRSNTLRFVGEPLDRIKEDPLRMLRGVRFSATKNLEMEWFTYKGIKQNSSLINNISQERIRMELDKILMSDHPSIGIKTLQDTGLLKHIIPELERCVNYNQNNSHHDKDLFNHILTVLKNTKPDLVTRLSALFHDIAKPDCYSEDNKGEGHYYLHHRESADMAENILRRLKYDNKTIEIVKVLIYNHMGKSDKQSDKSIKKFINRVGKENLSMIFDLMKSDILGHKAPHNFKSLNELKKNCERIINGKQPTTMVELAINGSDIIKLGYKQGKKIGEMLDVCMEYVLEHPENNNKECLLNLIK